MAGRSFQKWMVIGLFAVIAVVLLIALIQPEYGRESKPAESTRKSLAPPAGPLVDENFRKVVPLEELDVDLADPVAVSLLADKYFEQRKFEQAIALYEKAIELKPDDIDSINDLGLGYYYTGQPEKAVAMLKRGTEVIPSFQRVWLSLGFVSMSTGRNDEAEKAFTKAAEIDPDNDVGQEAMRLLGLMKQAG